MPQIMGFQGVCVCDQLWPFLCRPGREVQERDRKGRNVKKSSVIREVDASCEPLSVGCRMRPWPYFGEQHLILLLFYMIMSIFSK